MADRRGRLTTGAALAAAGVSLVWSVVHRPDVEALGASGHLVAALVGAVLVADVVYLAALAVSVHALLRLSVAVPGASRWARIRRLASMKHWTDDVLGAAVDDRRFGAAFAVNWVAASVAALVPAVAVILLLPVRSWGLLGLSALDLAGTMALRTTIRGQLRRLALRRAPAPAVP